MVPKKLLLLPVVWNCKQRHNELETYRFNSIDVQAHDIDEEVLPLMVLTDVGEKIVEYLNGSQVFRESHLYTQSESHRNNQI